jgi:hypothetical protein
VCLNALLTYSILNCNYTYYPTMRVYCECKLKLSVTAHAIDWRQPLLYNLQMFVMAGLDPSNFTFLIRTTQLTLRRDLIDWFLVLNFVRDLMFIRMEEEKFDFWNWILYFLLFWVCRFHRFFRLEASQPEMKTKTKKKPSKFKR